MIVPLDKLLAFEGNKYIFSRAAMVIVDKLENIKDYPEDDKGKVVSNVLDLLLSEKVKYNLKKEK